MAMGLCSSKISAICSVNPEDQPLVSRVVEEERGGYVLKIAYFTWQVTLCLQI